MIECPTATIEGLFISPDAADFYTSPAVEAVFDFDGIVGNERHRDRTRLADMRIKPYVRGVDVVLDRQQVSLVDTDSLLYIADELELDAELIGNTYEGETRETFLARCMGANILLSSFTGTGEVASFDAIPNATDFGPLDPTTGKFSSAVVMTTRYNSPCINPGKKIEEHYPGKSTGLAPRFVKAALGKRGFVGMVVKSGVMSVGQEVGFIPMPSSE